MPDPTPERVGELLREGQMDGLGFMELERGAGLREGTLERIVSESWQRQRAEIEALTALVRRSKDALARWNSHVDFELMCDIDDTLRARLAATGESDAD